MPSDRSRISELPYALIPFWAQPVTEQVGLFTKGLVFRSQWDNDAVVVECDPSDEDGISDLVDLIGRLALDGVDYDLVDPVPNERLSFRHADGVSRLTVGGNEARRVDPAWVLNLLDNYSAMTVRDCVSQKTMTSGASPMVAYPSRRSAGLSRDAHFIATLPGRGRAPDNDPCDEMSCASSPGP